LKAIHNRHSAWIETYPTSNPWSERSWRFLSAELEQLGHLLDAVEVIGELPHRAHDAILGTGERLSAYLLANHLNALNVRAEYIETAGLVSARDSRSSQDSWSSVQNAFCGLLSKLEEDTVPIVPGFFGVLPTGILGAVGRGYSDFTASLIAAGSKADELQIWTDVDGVLTGNPKVIHGARLLPELTYSEMAELSQFGAKVLHPYSVKPVVDQEIPIRILNTFNSSCSGTVVHRSTQHASGRPRGIRSITSKINTPVVSVSNARMLLAQGFLANMGTILASHGVSVDLIATSEISISVTLDRAPNDLRELTVALGALGEVSTLEGQTIISVVGERFAENVNLPAEALACLAERRIEVTLVSLGSSLSNFSVVVPTDRHEEALKALHARLLPE
jgi:aspartate kinase